MMTNLVLYVNAVQHPSEPLTMDCSSPFGATRVYETLFSSTGIHDDRAHMITLDLFTKGFFVLGFDLTADRKVDEEHVCLPRQGNVRIEARFKKLVPEPVTYILYAEFVGHIEIDSSRNVHSRMNNLQIHKVLTKLLKYFQGVYRLVLLASTHIKPSIIVINLDKHYMAGSHWVAVCFPNLDKPNILIRTGYHHSNLKSWHICSDTQFLGH